MTNLYGVDISNHQGPPSTYRNEQWYQDAEFVIVQAIAPPRPYSGWEVGGYTETQLRAAKEDGKYVGIYVWLWNSLEDTQVDIQSRLALVPRDLSLDMRPWLDVEDTGTNTGPSRRQDVLDALSVMDIWAAGRGLPMPGVYSGDWYINGYMQGWFPPGRMYWRAAYDEPPHVDDLRPVHQYSGFPIDLNVMLPSEITSVVPPPPEAPCREDELLQAMSYIRHDVLAPLRTYAPRFKKLHAAIAEIDRVAEQYGAG